MKDYLTLGMVVIILVLVTIQSFQIASLKNSGATESIQSGKVDMGDWTEDEKMMYEHHGTLPARLQDGSNPPQSTDMVGGC